MNEPWTGTHEREIKATISFRKRLIRVPGRFQRSTKADVKNLPLHRNQHKFQVSYICRNDPDATSHIAGRLELL
jgi:hypothetical protein